MHLKCSTMQKNINEIPGCSDISSIKSKQDYGANIKSLPEPQLLELLNRQNNLLKSSTLKKLPDKGEKILKIKKQIEDELARRNKQQDISDVLSKLSISEKKIDLLEWQEKNHEPDLLNKDEIIEDESNPFAILATHSGTNYNKKKVLEEKEEEPLIKLADIEEVYALNLCNKIDKTEPKKKFLPHKTLVSQSLVTKPKHRDLSAATPPNPVFGDVKLITLEESLKLQFEQTMHLKEVQMKHATERLKEMRYKMGDDLPSGESTKTYRDISAEQHSEEEISENECDEE